MTTALAPVSPHALADIAGTRLNHEQIELLKRTIAKGTTNDEFALFIATANRLGLDPFARQIFAVKRYDKKENREVMSIQISIDGYRVSAHRSGDVDGQEGPFWCGDDGVWREVWLHKDAPSAAKVIVYRKGCARPFVGVATYLSYVQRKQDGEPNSMWSRGPDFMLAKCAEALALRKAFPAELGGTITPEEAGTDVEVEVRPAFVALPSSTPAALSGAAPMPPITVASSPTTATTTPATEAKSKRAPLTETDAVEIEAAFKRCMTKVDLRKVVAERVGDLPPDDPMRPRLLDAHRAQYELIDHAEKAEKAEKAS